MKLEKQAGTTSEIWQVFVRDSSSTTGAGLAGLTNASAGLTAYYHRDTDTTATAISLVTMTIGTFTSSGFKEIDATNMPGWYQFCPPNAAIASGAKSVAIHLKGATNMAPLPIEVQLVGYNPESSTVLLASGTGAGQLDFTSGVVKANATQWLGGTIPAVNVTGVPLVDLKYTLGTISPAAAGSVRADAVTGAVGSVTGAVGSVTGAVGSVTGAVGSVAGNVGGNVVGSVASVTAGVTVTTNNDKTAYSLTQAFPTNFSALAISAGGHISNVDTLTTYTGNTVQTGDSFARIGVAGAGLTALGDTRIANLDATVSSRLAASGYTAPDNTSIATILTDVNTGAGAIYTRIGAPVGASIAADIAAVKSDSGGIKTKTDSLAFTVAGVVDSNVVDWKGSTAPAMTGDAYARIGAPAGASVSADVAAVKADTAGIKTKTDTLPASPAATGDAMTLTVAYDAAKTAAQSGDAMALTSGATQAIWDKLTSALTTVGSIGKLLVDNINATISSRLAASSYSAPPSAGTIAGAVWDESLSGHTTAGSAGAELTTAGTAGDPWTTALPGSYTAGEAGYILGHNLDAVVSTRSTYAGTDTSGTTTLLSRLTSGRAGNLDSLDVAVSTRLPTSGYAAPDNTDVLAIKAKTDNLPASPAATSDIPSASTIATAVWNVLTSALTTVSSIGKLLVTNVDAAVSSRSTYAGGDSAGTTTLLSRLTSGRAGNLDNLDTAVSTRLPTSSYVVPDNADILLIKAKTDNLPATPASVADIPTAIENADALLDRDMAAGADTSSNTVRTPRQSMFANRNKVAIAGGVMTVTKTDDTTASWTAAVLSDVNASPIIGIDPD